MKKLTVLLLSVLLLFHLPAYSLAAVSPVLGNGENLTVAAFGESFLVVNELQPDRVDVLDAATGAIKAFCLLGADSSAEEGVTFRVGSDCVLILTSRYAYRMNREFRIEDRILLPEDITGSFSVSENLDSILYQDGIYTVLRNLETGEEETLLTGDYDAFPQLIYSSPEFLPGDASFLLWVSNGTEYPVPAVYNLEEETLVQLDCLFDMDTEVSLVGNNLLLSGVLIPESDSSEDLLSDPSHNGYLRASGIYDLSTLRWTPLSLPYTGYGLQATGCNGTTVYYFQDVSDGWQLHSLSVADGSDRETVLTVSASNVEILAVTDAGHVLYRTFDLQDASSNICRIY